MKHDLAHKTCNLNMKHNLVHKTWNLNMKHNLVHEKRNLKVACPTFVLVCLSLNESTCQTRKNIHFTSKALFVLDKIKF